MSRDNIPEVSETSETRESEEQKDNFLYGQDYLSESNGEEDMKEEDLENDGVIEIGKEKDSVVEKDKVIVQVNIDDLLVEKYSDRDDIKERLIKKWGPEHKLKLNFRAGERVSLQKIKTSVVYCSKRAQLNCRFYLEFKTNPKCEDYKLVEYWNEHNHDLLEYDISASLTEEMLNEIRSLKNSVKSVTELTKFINEKFNRNFHRQTIYHQVKKLQEEELGKISADAKTFIQMLDDDAKNRNCFYKPRYQETQLAGCCYMSSRMRELLYKFSDVIIIDASHGTNRFNLPYLDIVCVNNFGQTSLCFFSLQPNQKYDSFEWSLLQFRSQLTKKPLVIFSDDEQSLRDGNLFIDLTNILAIKAVFPTAINFICSWHVQQNLKKRFTYLNRGHDQTKSDLYKKIINLPYSDYLEEFNISFNEIKRSKFISKELKQYLEDKVKEKDFWVKACMKTKFCCGMCTTSRIEGKHKVLKQFLNTGKRLTELFSTVKELESMEISNLKNEVQRSTKLERARQAKFDIIKHFQQIYTPYVIERLKDNLLESTNYKVVQCSNIFWYFTLYKYF
jgi:hypothetical protein